MTDDLDLPGWLTSTQRDVVADLVGRNLDAHGDDLLGAVLSGSVGRDHATEHSDLDVVVVLADAAAASRRTHRTTAVDEIVEAWSDLLAVPAFGSEWWWA